MHFCGIRPQGLMAIASVAGEKEPIAFLASSSIQEHQTGKRHSIWWDASPNILNRYPGSEPTSSTGVSLCKQSSLWVAQGYPAGFTAQQIFEPKPPWSWSIALSTLSRRFILALLRMLGRLEPCQLYTFFYKSRWGKKSSINWDYSGSWFWFIRDELYQLKKRLRIFLPFPACCFLTIDHQLETNALLQASWPIPQDQCVNARVLLCYILDLHGVLRLSIGN